MSDSTTNDATAKNWPMIALLFAVAIVPPLLLVLWWRSTTDGRLLGLGRMLYWLMPVVCAFAGGCFVWRWRTRTSGASERLRQLWPGLVLAVVATIVVFVLSPPQMRVQFDETSLVGTSQNMVGQRLAVMTTGAVPSAGEIVMLENMVDKRPTLFAFLVSVVHDFTGYRVANAFVVNGLLLAVGLFVLFAATRARLGTRAALAAPLLVLSVPLTSVVATSAGFELLATVLLLVTIVAAMAFIDAPSDGRMAALIGASVLLAHARYESLLAVVMIGLVALRYARKRYRPSLKVLGLLAACPTLVTPLFFLLEHSQDPNFTPEAGGQALVSFANLKEHAVPFLSAWFGSGLGSALPGWVAIPAIVLLMHRLFTRQTTCVDRLGVVPIVLTVVVLLWFYGDVREPTALRLFLPLAWASLLPLMSAPIVKKAQNGGSVLLVVALLMCAVRLPFVANGTAFPELKIATLTRSLDQIVARLPGDRATTLWVGVPAQHLIVKGHAAISVNTFLRLGRGVSDMMRRGDIVKIYLLETPLDNDMAPAFGSPRDLMSQIPNKVVERVGGDMPITVHQLGS